MISATEERLGIAVVDDDPLFLHLTCELLASQSKYEPLPATSGSELFGILNSRRVDCILLDYNLGSETGLSVKKRLDFLFKDSSPVIMLTGNGQESTAIEAFRMGVSDYIPKLSMNPNTLFSTISKVIAGERQKSMAKAEHKRLGEVAKIDSATGLVGRIHLDERLTQLAQLDPSDRCLYAVLGIEFREYLSILDHFGADIANVALRAFSNKLKEIAQINDLCGRYNGGKFIFIKKFDAYPPTKDLEIICNRLSEFLSFTINTAFTKLELSANVVIMNDNRQR